MGNLNDKFNYLAETKTLIKNALISKGIDVSDDDTFRSYVQKIIYYTTDATATENDILQGQTAYVNGQKVVGNIRTVRSDGSISGDNIFYTKSDDMIKSNATFTEDICYKTDSCILIENDAESFRNQIGLTPDKIKSGETVLGVEGTYKGLDTSDATATAEDIMEGKTAYVDGEKITGTASSGEDISEYFIDTFTGGGSAGPGIMYSIKKLPDDIKMVNSYSCSDAFSNLSNLEYLPKNLDTSTATTMSKMCFNCEALKEIPDTLVLDNVTTANSAFYGCESIVLFPKLNTSKVTNFSVFLAECTALETVEEIDMQSATNVSQCFRNDKQLINIAGFTNIGKAYTQNATNYNNYKLDISSSTLLTHESLMNVINNLYDLNITYDVANGGTLYTQSLVLGSTNLAKLTDEEKAIAINKGWSLS